MPDMYFDVDTAITECPVNLLPLLDGTDFKTIEDAVAYNAAGMALFWHFCTSAGAYTVTAVTPTTAGNYDWTDQGTSGIYTIEIPASGGASINNDTEGYGWFTGVATGVLPWRGPVIGFRAAAINDALMDGGDNLDVNTVQWLGTACATPTVAGVPEVDITHVAGATTNVSALATNVAAILADTGTDGVVVASASKTGYSLTATTGLGNQTANITGTITTATNVTTVNGLAANVITAASMAADAGAEIADAVWDELLSGHVVSGSSGEALSAAGTAGDPWTTALPGAYGAGTAGKIIGDNVNATISSRAAATALATAQTDLDTITGADGVTLATAQPSITFQPITITAGDAINNITLAGTGTSDGIAFTRTGAGNPFDANFAAQIQSECNDAIVAYDPATGTEVGTLQTSVNDIPTNAELATALGTADDATLAAIAALSIPTAAENATAVLTTQMTESYRAAGAAPTLAQSQFETIAHLGDSAISGTTKTIRNIAGTAAKTYTLDDATTPTSITEAT